MMKIEKRGDFMSDGFGNDFITISDDDGNEFVLEHIDTVEEDGNYYMAFLPTDMDEDDESYGLIILKKVDKDGEEVLITLESEDELSKMFDIFAQRLSEDVDED